MKLCECGCGRGVSKKRNKFILGHAGIQTRFKVGHPVSRETRNKLSKAHTGKKYPANLYPNHGMRGKHLPEGAKKKLSILWTGRRLSEEVKKKLILLHTGKPLSKEHKKKLSDAWSWEKHFTEKTIQKLSKATIRAFQRGCYDIRPTTPELKFTKFCEKHNLPYKYVGDGKFWIENMNPDFVEVNGRKIAIEILGDYWHDEAEFSKRQKKFAKYGWRVIGIWESELEELPENMIVLKVISAGR